MKARRSRAGDGFENEGHADPCPEVKSACEVSGFGIDPVTVAGPPGIFTPFPRTSELYTRNEPWASIAYGARSETQSASKTQFLHEGYEGDKNLRYFYNHMNFRYLSPKYKIPRLSPN